MQAGVKSTRNIFNRYPRFPCRGLPGGGRGPKLPAMEHCKNSARAVPAETDAPPPSAGRILRGVLRLLHARDYRALTEFPLPDGRRADIVALDRSGLIEIVEVKSSLADFRADVKWPDYRSYCDGFYFAVDAAFPRERLPTDTGLIVADAFDAIVLRSAPAHTLNAARRRALLVRFARAAAGRLAATDSMSLPAAPW